MLLFCNRKSPTPIFYKLMFNGIHYIKIIYFEKVVIQKKGKTIINRKLVFLFFGNLEVYSRYGFIGIIVPSSLYVILVTLMDLR